MDGVEREEGRMEGKGRRAKGGGGAREGGLREGLRGREIHQPTRKTRPSLADMPPEDVRSTNSSITVCRWENTFR